MLYMWAFENTANKYIATYDMNISFDRFLLQKGIDLNRKEVARSYCYLRSTTLDLHDDPLIRIELRPNNRRAYIFTPSELFYCAGGIVKKVKITADNFLQLKKALSLQDADVDKPPKILSDQQLEIIGTFKSCPQFSRIPILHVEVTKAEIAKFDCISNTANTPLVNPKVVDLLFDLASEEIQFFDTEVYCKDGILKNYKLLNITRTIKGIDHEKSLYSKMKTVDAILGFKYLTYKPGCMGRYKLARDEEYHSNLLATEEIKQAFDKAKIKGVCFVRPEEFYRPLKPEDLLD